MLFDWSLIEQIIKIFYVLHCLLDWTDFNKTWLDRLWFVNWTVLFILGWAYFVAKVISVLPPLVCVLLVDHWRCNLVKKFSVLHHLLIWTDWVKLVGQIWIKFYGHILVNIFGQIWFLFCLELFVCSLSLFQVHAPIKNLYNGAWSN